MLQLIKSSNLGVEALKQTNPFNLRPVVFSSGTHQCGSRVLSWIASAFGWTGSVAVNYMHRTLRLWWVEGCNSHQRCPPPLVAFTFRESASQLKSPGKARLFKLFLAHYCVSGSSTPSQYVKYSFSPCFATSLYCIQMLSLKQR